ncbi:MAG: FxsA family protein, partial [Bacillota bacterium]
MTKLILLFTIIPLIELWALIRLSRVLGGGLTILLIACTGTIGAILTKRQSTSVLKKINDSLAQGQIPADKLIDGLL